MGRPEEHLCNQGATRQLGNGLYAAEHYADALVVYESQLSALRRLGASEGNILTVQGNLASTYRALGLHEQALRLRQEAYTGRLKFFGEEHRHTFLEANNFGNELLGLRRFEEAKLLLRKTLPAARRVFGEGGSITLKMRKNYAQAFVRDANATLDDLREAVTSLKELAPTARRVLGGSHPIAAKIESDLRDAQAALRARETPTPTGSA